MYAGDLHQCLARAVAVRDAQLAVDLAAPHRGEREPGEAPQGTPVAESAAEDEDGSATAWTLETPVEVAEIESAIGTLPEGARDALVLHALYGYSHGEAAQMLGIAEGTCKAQLHRARRLLRERLGVEVS